MRIIIGFLAGCVGGLIAYLVAQELPFLVEYTELVAILVFGLVWYVVATNVDRSRPFA